jgi:guanosine-3',5'-bis(diphosphate) 3'-pyrophosphohydrolase
MEKILKQVKDFSDRAHGKQMRKYAPDRYIVHPVRVMEICRQFTSSAPVLAAALLHDVLEDTDTDKDQLYEFLTTIMDEKDARHTLQLVVELTDVYTKANYPHLNRRKRKTKESERLANTSAESQSVKYADIIDNSNEIVEQDPDFANVFLRECSVLLKNMNKGDRQLHQQAIEVVDSGLKKLRENQH